MSNGNRLIPVLLLLPSVLFAGSCTWLKSSSPLLPVREYEKMLVGPLEANYIGNENCLKACHQHDQIALYLRESVHGQQVESGTGMPLVNCETCHGPGSLAVEHAAENKKCDTTKLIQLKELPAAAVSLLCLKCHSSNSMLNMHHWPTSTHALAEVSCSDCHKLHEHASQKLRGLQVNDLCSRCHPEVATQFRLFSRHPLLEGKMTCVTCHEPHGSLRGDNLAGPDQKTLCLNCHAEKTGPFIYEHGDLMEDCGNCHAPHGSPFAGLLRYQEPFLCLACHTGHADQGSPDNPSRGFKQGIFTKCTNCHSQVHGSDTKGDFPRSGFTR